MDGREKKESKLPVNFSVLFFKMYICPFLPSWVWVVLWVVFFLGGLVGFFLKPILVSKSTLITPVLFTVEANHFPVQ